MPSRKNSGLADRVVRKRLADGSVKEYRYPRVATPVISAGSLRAVLNAYKSSPEWIGKAPATKETQAIYLRHLDDIGHLPLSDIKRRMLLTLRDGIAAGSGNGAATMFVRCCSTFFTWAVSREYIEHSPVIGIKALPGGHWRAWTQPLADAAMAVLTEPLRRAMVLALYTGQRRADLVAMRWSDYSGRAIAVAQAKTKTKLLLPIHLALKKELTRWKAEAKSPFIIETARGTQWTPGGLSHRLKYLLVKNKLPDIGIHGMRKLAAANLAEAGCSANEIAAVTGHLSLSMVQLYTAGADQKRLADAAIARLSKARKNQRQLSKKHT